MYVCVCVECVKNSHGKWHLDWVEQQQESESESDGILLRFRVRRAGCWNVSGACCDFPQLQRHTEDQAQAQAQAQAQDQAQLQLATVAAWAWQQ